MRITHYTIGIDSEEAAAPSTLFLATESPLTKQKKGFIDIANIQAKSNSTRSVVPHTFDHFKDKLLENTKDPSGKPEHDEYVAKLLMYVAGWSYSDLPAFKDMLERALIKGVDCIEIETKNDPMFICATAQVIRSLDGKVAIVSFRGTELTNIVNWLTDATTSTIEAFPDNIKVHAGFLRNFQVSHAFDCVFSTFLLIPSPFSF